MKLTVRHLYYILISRYEYAASRMRETYLSCGLRIDFLLKLFLNFLREVREKNMDLYIGRRPLPWVFFVTMRSLFHIKSHLVEAIEKINNFLVPFISSGNATLNIEQLNIEQWVIR